MIIIAGSASPRISQNIADLLACQIINPGHKTFPDGEFYLRMEVKMNGNHALVVQSTCPPQNDNLVELCLLLDAARDLGAKRITAVVPYLAYARQTKQYKPGEAVSLRTVSKMIANAGADELITVDIHDEQSIKNYSSIPVMNLTAMPLLGQHLKRFDLKNPIILGADKGSMDRAVTVAAEIGADHDYLEKVRVTPKKVITVPRTLSVANRDVVIVDDVISTGWTIIGAAKLLRRQGARRIYAACTHPILAGKARHRLRVVKIKRVISTDTIEKMGASVVSVAPLISEAVK